MTLLTTTYDSKTHKLVPIEPTTAMLDVAVSHALMVKLSSGYNWTQYMTDVWARMVGAAMAQEEK